MAQLTASVGHGGTNRKADVRLAQGLLNNYKIPGISNPITIDAKIGNNTYSRIEVFQKKYFTKQNLMVELPRMTHLLTN